MLRPALIVLLVASLAGCATVRKSLGEYQKAADKGISFGGPPGAISGPSAAENVNQGPDLRPQHNGRAELPGGLGGDKAHAAYTSTPQD